MSADSTSNLTVHPPGGLRELVVLCVPLMLGLLSASLMGFCDRIFLGHYGLEAMEASVSAGYLCMLFQLPLIRLVSMSQVFVGLYNGAKQPEKIGPAVWQMIWLSIFSMLLTLPASQFVAPFFFGGTSVQGQATIYFKTLMLANFLFPLGTALSSHFLGRGQIRIIILTTLFSHGMNIGLDYLFIFGCKGIFPSLGIFGAALATGISQLLFCVILLFAFLDKENRRIYQTGRHHFKWEIFWGQLRIGMPRVVARIIILTAWVSISRLMTLKGGDYLMVLSIGGSLILLFTFILDGLLQGMVTIASNLMGSKNYSCIWRLIRSSIFFLGFLASLLSIPYLFFPDLTISFFFKETPAPSTIEILRKTCLWLWIFFICSGFNAITQSLITASRDLSFFLCSIIFVWATSYLPVYLGMNHFGFSADKLWLIMAFDSFVFGVLFLYRASKEKWREKEKDFELEPLSKA